MLRGDVVHQLASLAELFFALGTAATPLELTSVELKLLRLKDVPHGVAHGGDCVGDDNTGVDTLMLQKNKKVKKVKMKKNAEERRRW